jgi:RNA polymerase sigma-70 factor (ECF subfamily)
MKIPERQPVSAALATLPTLDNDRLGRLFAAHYRRVLMSAYRITGNMADAEDVTQAVFLRLGAGEIPALANTAGYLYRAAINGAFDLLRRRRTAPSEPLEMAAEVRSGAFSAPDAELANRELGGQLRRAIAELAPRAAEMFALRYLEELSNGEIAKLMDTSQAVVAVTLYQSRSKLKKRLIEFERGAR